jgi:mono/diheme cytochrome c family protein
MRAHHTATTFALAASLIATALPTGAMAASAATVKPQQLYAQECGACHIAYPATLLPAPSWQRLMKGLDQHFGADASLAPEVNQALRAWLVTQADQARRQREAPPQDRITRAAWFAREHHEVPQAVWAHPSVKSPANCVACHSGATRGDFNEHAVRLPAAAGRLMDGDDD